MIADPLCPTCNSRDWSSLGRRTYDRASIDSEKSWSRTALQILFENWVPDCDAFEAEFVGCNKCSLMIYRPRPSEADITSKYRAIGGMGDATPSKGESPERTRQRANRIARILSPYLPDNGGAVLDYGGGDGRLLQTFISRGRFCHLIDYANRPIDGVTKVGDTEADLASDARYAAIVCSHVVEHLPDPLPALRLLGNALEREGAIYVEVPFEVFGNLPARREPVTHVNFFTPESMAALLQAAGLEVIRSRLTMYPHPSGGWAMAVGALARRPNDGYEINWPGGKSLEKALSPSTAKKIYFSMRWRAGKAYSQFRDRSVTPAN